MPSQFRNICDISAASQGDGEEDGENEESLHASHDVLFLKYRPVGIKCSRPLLILLKFISIWSIILQKGVTEMTVLKKLKDYLDKNQVSYEVGYHQRVYTAQEIAAAQHVPGKELAKVVMVKADGNRVMLVLPASYRVDMKKLKGVLKCKRVGMVKEEDFEELFPDCEIGAMPPFGNLYNLEVWVDQVLAEDESIVFQAGSHVETLRIKYSDYARLVNPKVSDFSVHL
jgi:Ala-tRNA(Pro) deacylase